MDKIAFLNLQKHSEILKNNSVNFKVGEVIQAKVLQNTDNGLLLLIGKTPLLAKTNFKFPPGTKLNLFVASFTNNKLILSLNKRKNIYDTSIADIISNLGLEEEQDTKYIVSKLIEKKLKISKENFQEVKFLINQLPLEIETSLDLITDPTLYAAVFNIFDNATEGFTLLFSSVNENEQKESYYEINILYNSHALGYILAGISWVATLNINLICSEKETYKLLQQSINDLKQRLKYIPELRLNIELDNSLLNRINKQEFKKIDLKSIDILI
ncbi:MAG: hypothetical protein PWQ67_2419 [Clostridia bacterium]|jgi:hypothetical protein|nr:hypothetical protein [Clostridia bacterium]MDN5323965.1 hypothetical protein [Clostridia bacterium]